MAFFDSSRTSYGTASAVYRFVCKSSDITSKMVAWNDARVTRGALSKLTDRELEDIGLQRGEIESVARSYMIR